MKYLMLCLLCLTTPAFAGTMTIGIEQPEDGTSYALICEKIESILLVKNGTVTWGGLPTWKSVKGSTRVETCPLSQGGWFKVQTEALRNYQITARLIHVDSTGKVLSNRVLPPYFWFDRGESSRPKGPVILLQV